MPETIIRPYSVMPVHIRTARKRHMCSDCEKPIEPGTRYELSITPPHRIPEYDVDRWLTWRTHYPRHDGLEFLPGCKAAVEAAAFREKAEREAAAACTYVALLAGERFPCHSHEGGLHHFAAAIPDPCMAPFCRLPAGHRTLHDIPSGRAEIVEADA